jgi:predicted transcriptional regulator
MSELKIHIGGDVEAMGRRFVSAWRRAEAGQEVNERHLTFATFKEAASVLSPRRLELLRAIHRRPAASVRALAEAVGRDYKNVHGDVRILVEAGLVDRDDLGGISADYDAIAVEMAIAL